MPATLIRPRSFIATSTIALVKDHGTVTAATAGTTVAVTTTTDVPVSSLVVLYSIGESPSATGTFSASITAPGAGFSSTGMNTSSGGVGVTGTSAGGIIVGNPGGLWVSGSVITMTYSVSCAGRALRMLEFSGASGHALENQTSNGVVSSAGPSAAVTLLANDLALGIIAWNSLATTISGVTAGWTTVTNATGAPMLSAYQIGIAGGTQTLAGTLSASASVFSNVGGTVPAATTTVYPGKRAQSGASSVISQSVR